MSAGPVLDALGPRNGHMTAAGWSPSVSSEPEFGDQHGWYLTGKSLLDSLVALLLLIASAPIIVACALLVKATSPGPAFYMQTRLGRYGRPFRLYKLRTMFDGAESKTGPVWCRKGDPRITRVGRFLRETHLDEFPQLINVLRGEMSLIGPRPERPEIIAKLERDLPGYRQRLTVRPGITGLAQMRLPADSDLAGVRRKLAHDLYYVQRVSPWLDLRILCCTAAAFIASLLVFAWKPFALPDCDPADESRQPAGGLDLYGSAVSQTVLKN